MIQRWRERRALARQKARERRALNPRFVCGPCSHEFQIKTEGGLDAMGVPWPLQPVWAHARCSICGTFSGPLKRPWKTWKRMREDLAERSRFYE